MHLVTAGKLYPGAWRLYDQFRQDRGRDGLPDWPDWCYCPLAGAYAVVSGGGDNRVPDHMVGDVARLGAIAAWRVTQGIYRFDDEFRAHLLETSLEGDLPCALLFRLPEWCVYVETPKHVMSAGEPLHGFFAHLECDANTGREELRLLLDGENNLTPVPLHLGAWPISEAASRAVDVSRVHALGMGASIPSSVDKRTAAVAAPLISLLLYLCSEDAEFGDGPARPAKPIPKRTKDGWRLFPADKPRIWEVGVRIGAALRKSRELGAVGDGAEGAAAHARMRAHFRRAHWHTYLYGQGRAERRLKWVHPVLVNVDSPENLPAVIKAVRRD